MKVPARCFLLAWLFAWVVAIFLPSLLTVIFGAPGSEAGHGATLPFAVFDVADEMGPVVKLGLGGSLMVMFWPTARLAPGAWRWLGAIAAGFLAFCTVLALVPQGFSRGFGIALADERFSHELLPIYFAGAVASGLTFAWNFGRCSKRRRVSKTLSRAPS